MVDNGLLVSTGHEVIFRPCFYKHSSMKLFYPTTPLMH